MDKDTKKAQLYVYVESDIPSRDDGWKKTNVELTIDQGVRKLSWRTSEDSVTEVGGWGSNNIVAGRKDIDRLTGELLTLADAMIGDKEQRDAWKKLLRSTIHKWHDEKFNRYELTPKDIKELQ